MVMTVASWGPYILLPHPMKFEDAPVAGGVPVDPVLSEKDYLEDPEVIRAASRLEIPAHIASDVRLPQAVPHPDLNLTGIWYLPNRAGGLFSYEAFWHRSSNISPRAPEDPRSVCDLRVLRSRVNAPVLVQVGEPEEPEAAITSWSITPVMVGRAHGLYHGFRANPQIDPVTQRAWLQADGVEWLDDFGFRNVVMSWQSSLDELLELALSLG